MKLPTQSQLTTLSLMLKLKLAPRTGKEALIVLCYRKKVKWRDLVKIGVFGYEHIQNDGCEDFKTVFLSWFDEGESFSFPSGLQLKIIAAHYGDEFLKLVPYVYGYTKISFELPSKD